MCFAVCWIWFQCFVFFFRTRFIFVVCPLPVLSRVQARFIYNFYAWSLGHLRTCAEPRRASARRTETLKEYLVQIFYKKIEKRQLWVLPCEWLKLNFASCVVHQIFTQIIVRPCSMFYPYEGYRSETPLDAARVNRTIFPNHSVHWYYITIWRKLNFLTSRSDKYSPCLLYTSPSPRD